jgi:hypothetical protein
LAGLAGLVGFVVVGVVLPGVAFVGGLGVGTRGADGAVDAGLAVGSGVGKTRGARVTPGGTSCGVCQGRQAGPATDATTGADPERGSGAPAAEGTAYAISPTVTAASTAPADRSVRGRRERGWLGVIAGKD